MIGAAAALLVVASAAAPGTAGGEEADGLPARLGPLKRVGTSDDGLAIYSTKRNIAGKPFATLRVFDPGVTNAQARAEDERVHEGGVVDLWAKPPAPLPELASCSGASGRLSASLRRDGDWISLVAWGLRGGRVVRLRGEAPASDGRPLLNRVLIAFRTGVLSC